VLLPDSLSMTQEQDNGERARRLLCAREALAKPSGAAAIALGGWI